MSFVILFVVFKKKLTVLNVHYSAAKALIENSLQGIEILKNSEFLHNELDAGYIFIDIDAKMIFNKQNAFFLKLKKWMEGFEIVNC